MEGCVTLWAIKTVRRELILCRSFPRYESVNVSLVRPENTEIWMGHSSDKDGLPLKRH